MALERASDSEAGVNAGMRDEDRDMDRLYEQFGRPLEADHWGEFLVVSADGRTLLAPTLIEAVDQAVERFGPGNTTFRVGEQVVGSIL